MASSSDGLNPQANHFLTPSASESNRGSTRGRGRGRARPRRPKAEAGPIEAAQAAQSESAVSVGPSNRGAVRGRSRRGRGNARPAVNGESQQHLVPSQIPSNGQTSASSTIEAPASQTPARGRGSRRARFGSRITNAQEDHAHAAPSAPASMPVPTEHSSLQARLTYDLLHNAIECAICMSTVAPTAQIHSCSTCSTISHLKCISQWASRSITELQTRNRTASSSNPVVWRCPSCQSTFSESEQPKTYRCFCGRQANPKPAKNAGGILPHSCGQSCAKARPEGCSHACPNQCHPGPCLPCKVVVSVKCYCGKDEKQMQCSTLHPALKSSPLEDGNVVPEKVQVKSCGAVCGKLLGCGLHQCEDVCHAGDCGQCEYVREKICFCGLEKIEEICETSEHSPADRIKCLSDGSTVDWTGEFACEAPCQWYHDCGRHKCTLSPRCHPHIMLSRPPCPFSPKAVTHCPCGQTRLSSSRKSCTDPIPPCSKICNKLLSCSHQCQQRCHIGPCPPCPVQVTTPCRCGHDKRTLPCHHQTEEEFRCNRICKAMRHCGRHECGQKCCPLAFQESLLGKKGKPGLLDAAALEDPAGVHLCPLICNKPLSCGIHFCERNDHRGPCGRCLASNFSEVSCHCGGTVLMPPVPCGTKIKCDLPCARRPLACGHPKIPHACHEDNISCPPCTFLVEKECQCHKRIKVKNIRCAQEKVSCGTVCGSLLGCGAHQCRKLCHKIGDCEGCTQPCGRLKPFCGHPHEAPCHAPAACVLEAPCLTMVEASCACGHVKQRILCGASNARPSSASEKVLKCLDSCAVIKRNAALAEALGLERGQAEPLAVKYEDETLDYYLAHPAWCADIEKTLQAFLVADKLTHLFPPMKWVQRKFTHELIELYGMKGESLDAEPHRSVHVTKSKLSFKPSNPVGEAAAEYKKAKLLGLRAPAEKVARTRPAWNALYLCSVFGHSQSSLRSIVQQSIQPLDFDLRWVTDEDVLIVPLKVEALTSGDLEQKLRGVKHSLTSNTATICTGGIEGANIDSTGQITWRDTWAVVGGSNTTSGTTTPSRWAGSNSKSIYSANAFAALGTGDSRPAPAKHDTSSWTILSGGWNRPPSAVIAPSTSASTSAPMSKVPSRTKTPQPPPKEIQADVADDWEEGLSQSVEDLKVAGAGEQETKQKEDDVD